MPLLGDGTNEASALQTMLDAACDANADELAIPKGAFRILSPVTQKSGCWLRGKGPLASTIYNDNAADTDNLLVLGATSTYNEGGAVERLKFLNAGRGACIWSNKSLEMPLQHLRIGGGGAGINIQAAYPDIGPTNYRCEISNIREDASSQIGDSFIKLWAINAVVRLVRYSASLHANWATYSQGHPIFDIRGNEITLDHCIIEPSIGSGQDAYGLYMEGYGHHIRSLHIEIHRDGGTITNGYAYVFNDCDHLLIDYLDIRDVEHRVNFTGSGHATIDNLDLTASEYKLSDLVTVGSDCFLRVHRLYNDFDPGQLDSPNIIIDEIINRNPPRRAFRNLPPTGANLVKPASTFTIAATGGATYGTVTRTGRTISVASVVMPLNSTIAITVPLTSSAGNMAQWRGDSPGNNMIVTTEPGGANFTTRAINSMTRAKLPDARSELKFTFYSQAGATSGTISLADLEVWIER